MKDTNIGEFLCWRIYSYVGNDAIAWGKQLYFFYWRTTLNNLDAILIDKDWYLIVDFGCKHKEFWTFIKITIGNCIFEIGKSSR